MTESNIPVERSATGMSILQMLGNGEDLSHRDQVDVRNIVGTGDLRHRRPKPDRDRGERVTGFDGVRARLRWSASTRGTGAGPAFGRDRHRSRDRQLVARFEQLRVGADQLTDRDAIFDRDALKSIAGNDLVFLRSFSGCCGCDRGRPGKFVQFLQRAVEEVHIHIGVDTVNHALFTVLPDGPFEPAARQ